MLVLKYCGAREAQPQAARTAGTDDGTRARGHVRRPVSSPPRRDDLARAAVHPAPPSRLTTIVISGYTPDTAARQQPGTANSSRGGMWRRRGIDDGFVLRRRTGMLRLAGAKALLLVAHQLVSYQILVAAQAHGQCTPGLSGDLCCESSHHEPTSARSLMHDLSRRRLAEW